MAEEIIIEGKTFEAAMAEAQTKYNGENVQYEILEMPKRGIFGIGATPARIKVIINDDADDEDTDLSGIVASIKGLGVTTNRGGGEEKSRSEQPAKDKREDRRENKRDDRRENKRPREERAEKRAEAKAPAASESSEDAAAVKTEQKQTQKREHVAKEPRVIEVTDAEKECALKFANTLLQDMGVEAEARFTGSEPSGIGGNTYPHMEIAGEGAGILIGHHGETLDAI